MLHINFILHIILLHKRLSRTSYQEASEDKDVTNDYSENNKGSTFHRIYNLNILTRLQIVFENVLNY